MMNSLRMTVFGLALVISASGLTEVPNLRQIMADPTWIGAPVEQAWWQLDGQSIVYRTPLGRDADRDFAFHRLNLADGADQMLEPAAQADLDGPSPVFDESGRRALFVRSGNLFLRDRDQGSLRQLTQGPQADELPMFGADGSRVYFRRQDRWWGVDLSSGLSAPLADLRFADDPHDEPEDKLARMQLRLFSSLREDAERERRRAETERRAWQDDPSRPPPPVYLGDQQRLADSRLSPDGRHLLLIVEPAKYEGGQDGQMPHYVTRDGYVDIEAVRTRVGRNPPAPQSIRLLDLETLELRTIALSSLPGIDRDPLAEYKQAQDLPELAEDELRAVRVTGIEWRRDGRQAAVQVRAIDNKDRWLITVDATTGQTRHRHRLTDPAWINWQFNDFGWIGDSQDLWFLSEHSGFSHLYTIGADSRRARALTDGPFEVMDPVFSHDASAVFLISNRSHPSEYDLYRIDLPDGELTRLTEQRGIESFALLPGDERILLRYSAPYLPPQAGWVRTDGGPLIPLTDTRSEAFGSVDWQAPQIVGVESSHGSGTIWSKFYPAKSPALAGQRPAVLFVHGAGYLQNTRLRYPQYFREQMFHNLLTERGYFVLDMDYRASRGYGRDWRTAIYQQMGTPELEDLIDGVHWLVNNHGVDPDRIGIYGGSYGGFMTFMALFKAPDVFRAGAALRPVSDWVHYNHPYTSNILNTPELDPQAYAQSSPIEFADGFSGRLLITHGMLDDNVFYQDVVRLAQRLIDLEKDGWELASYPLERHGFVRPASWRDQYQRILKLFEETIGGN